jgi:hypothetical protein
VTDDGLRVYEDVSNRSTIRTGASVVPPLLAAAGAGCGGRGATNIHNLAPMGMVASVKYLFEELGADVNAVDHEGNTAMRNAGARGDVEMILYLVAKGADPRPLTAGKATADMANGPVQRIQPWPRHLRCWRNCGW